MIIIKIAVKLKLVFSHWKEKEKTELQSLTVWNVSCDAD